MSTEIMECEDCGDMYEMVDGSYMGMCKECAKKPKMKSCPPNGEGFYPVISEDEGKEVVQVFFNTHTGDFLVWTLGNDGAETYRGLDRIRLWGERLPDGLWEE